MKDQHSLQCHEWKIHWNIRDIMTLGLSYCGTPNKVSSTNTHISPANYVKPCTWKKQDPSYIAGCCSWWCYTPHHECDRLPRKHQPETILLWCVPPPTMTGSNTWVANSLNHVCMNISIYLCENDLLPYLSFRSQQPTDSGITNRWHHDTAPRTVPCNSWNWNLCSSSACLEPCKISHWNVCSRRSSYTIARCMWSFTRPSAIFSAWGEEQASTHWASTVLWTAL